MKVTKYLMSILLGSLLVFSLSACEGEAENAGEKIDNAMTDAGNAIEDACEDVKKGVNAEDTDC